jgi:hypothetical protein
MGRSNRRRHPVNFAKKIGLSLMLCIAIGTADGANAGINAVKGKEIGALLLSHRMHVKGRFLGNTFSGELQWFSPGKFRVVSGFYVDRSGKRTPAVNAGGTWWIDIDNDYYCRTLKDDNHKDDTHCFSIYRVDNNTIQFRDKLGIFVVSTGTFN